MRYGVTGFFYEESGHRLRKYLDIRRESLASNKPELMVVMMNPGSSYPLDGNDNGRAPAEARADTTQRQIMKLMEATHLGWARVLNLSDLRTPDSAELFRFLRADEARKVDHSIFSANRQSELNDLYSGDVPVVFGWGVNPILAPLAEQAIEALNVRKPLGIRKADTCHYYHPLPRVYARQQEWLRQVAGQVRRARRS